MSVKVWDVSNVQSPLVRSHDKHREFVTDIDNSLFYPNLVASCSFDKKVCVFDCLKEQPYK